MGLAVTPSGYMPGFPGSMIDAANAGVPADRASGEGILHRHHPAADHPDPQAAGERAHRVGEIHRQFIEFVLSGGTYRDIAQEIAQRVGRPVTIVDRFRRVLGEGIVLGHPPVHEPFFRMRPAAITT